MPSASASALREIFLAQVRAKRPCPASAVIDRPDWFQITTPSVPHVSHNGVWHSEVDDARLDATVDRALAGYESAGLPMVWWTGPPTRPARTGSVLASRGLVETVCPAMVCDPGDTEIEIPHAVAVETVGAEQQDEFLATAAEGWQLDDAVRAAFASEFAHTLGDARRIAVLARIDGEPAGCAEATILGDLALLTGGVVLPRFRGRGVYRSLLQSRLSTINQRRISLAVTHARADSSAPILGRLGFATAYTARVYCNSLGARHA